MSNLDAEIAALYGDDPEPPRRPRPEPVPEPEPEPEPLRWTTARELADTEPERPDWVLEGYIARGALTELTAKVKIGKSTLLLAAVRAITAGAPFLGRATAAGPVVYLTEERPPTFRAALARVGLEDCPDLHILFRSEAFGRDWPEVAAEATEHAQNVGAVLLAVDTLGDWSNVVSDEENASGAALEAMRPLQAAAAAGLAVLSVRHDRKSGGDVGDSGRGSSAYAGASDVLVSVRRAQGQGHENRRVLAAVGRFDEVPAELVVDFAGGEYVACGDARAVAHSEALEWVREHLPMGRDWAATVAELLQRAKDSDADVSRSTLQRALGELMDSGEAAAEKGAAPGHPRAVGYWLAGTTNELPSK
jgi:hypothetical protein